MSAMLATAAQAGDVQANAGDGSSLRALALRTSGQDQAPQADDRGRGEDPRRRRAALASVLPVAGRVRVPGGRAARTDLATGPPGRRPAPLHRRAGVPRRAQAPQDGRVRADSAAVLGHGPRPDRVEGRERPRGRHRSGLPHRGRDPDVLRQRLQPRPDPGAQARPASATSAKTASGTTRASASTRSASSPARCSQRGRASRSCRCRSGSDIASSRRRSTPTSTSWMTASAGRMRSTAYGATLGPPKVRKLPIVRHSP